MKLKAKLLLAILFLFSFILAKTKENQNIYYLKVLDKFGGLHVPEKQMLNLPIDIALSKEGQIYILDSRDHNIKVFQKNGSFIKCIGREGSGPGEFSRPWILDIIENKIYVADTNNRRIQVLNKDGKYESSFKVPIRFGHGMAFDSKGYVYLNTQGFKNNKLISVYDTKGLLIREFGNLEGEPFEIYNFPLIRKEIRNGKVPDNFKNDLLLNTDGRGGLFAVHRALNKSKKFSLKGELLKVAEINAPEYKNIYKAFREKNRENNRGFFALHYVNNLEVDKERNLYILLNEPSRMIVYVYSNEGEFKGKLLGVKDNIFRIAISHDNILYALGGDSHFIYKFRLDIE